MLLSGYFSMKIRIANTFEKKLLYRYYYKG